MNTNEHEHSPLTFAEQDELFADALEEGWNREMDWIWLNTKLTNQARQRYCLEKALEINPESEMAKSAIKSLTTPEHKPILNRIKKLVTLVTGAANVNAQDA